MRDPNTGPPDIAIAAVVPGAGDVDVVGGRRGHGRAGFHGRGRWRKILNLLLLGAVPEAGGPLPAVGGVMPGARYPGSSRRHGAPEAADPQEVIAAVVP